MARFEKRGYKLVGLKMIQPNEKFLKEHYADLSDKPFFKGYGRHLFQALYLKARLNPQTIPMNSVH